MRLFQDQVWTIIFSKVYISISFFERQNFRLQSPIKEARKYTPELKNQEMRVNQWYVGVLVFVMKIFATFETYYDVNSITQRNVKANAQSSADKTNHLCKRDDSSEIFGLVNEWRKQHTHTLWKNVDIDPDSYVSRAIFPSFLPWNSKMKDL